MKINIKSELKTIMSNPDSKFNYFGWPSVARLQNGKIAVVASGYRMGHICPFGKCVMALSDDNGETYTGAFPIIDTYLDDRDGGICTFGDNGVIVSSFNNTRKMQRDNNLLLPELEDWMLKRNKFYHAYLDTVSDESEEKYIGSLFRISLDCGKTFSEFYKSPVTSPHGPIELKDGSILWIGRTFSEDDSFDEKTSRIKAYKIKLDGSMEYLSTIPPIYENGLFMCSCEPAAIELPDGRIICQIRISNAGYFTLYQTESSNGGLNWTTPKMILDKRGGSPAHLLLHSNGTLISTYGFRDAPYGIKAMFSKDLGKTWETDLWVYDNNGISGDLGYPSSIELDNGDILTIFYARDEAKGPATIKQIIWNFE